MFDVVVDAEVIERLATHLELLSAELTYAEWAHLIALIGLGSTTLGEAVVRPELRSSTRGAALQTPGFADALELVADALGRRTGAEEHTVITRWPESGRWEVLTRSVHRRGTDS